jgi:hypothetical protein
MSLNTTKLNLSFISLFFVILLYQCETGNRKLNDRSKTSSFEDFDEFYRKFTSDSLFQMSRIKFPLAGKSVDEFDVKEWTKENWSLMKTMIFDIDTATYKTEYKKSSKEFKGKVWIEGSGFNYEFRFEVINDRWYLVYALDQNL